MRLLIIDDDIAIIQTLKDNLKRHYIIDQAQTAKRGLHLAKTNPYDLIILDLGLPDGTGLEVCSQIRAWQIKSPILVLTGQYEEVTKIALLDAGADDYLIKPFSLDELRARIRALLRRPVHSLTPTQLTVAGLILDTTTRQVKRDGQLISLRRKEFDILEYLMRHKGMVVSREMLLEHVWESNTTPFTNAIDVHIKYLRDSVDKPFAPKLIRTIHGVGYMIDNPLPASFQTVQKGGDRYEQSY